MNTPKSIVIGIVLISGLFFYQCNGTDTNTPGPGSVAVKATINDMQISPVTTSENSGSVTDKTVKATATTQYQSGIFLLLPNDPLPYLNSLAELKKRALNIEYIDISTKTVNLIIPYDTWVMGIYLLYTKDQAATKDNFATISSEPAFSGLTERFIVNSSDVAKSYTLKTKESYDNKVPSVSLEQGVSLKLKTENGTLTNIKNIGVSTFLLDSETAYRNFYKFQYTAELDVDPSISRVVLYLTISYKMENSSGIDENKTLNKTIYFDKKIKEAFITLEPISEVTPIQSPLEIQMKLSQYKTFKVPNSDKTSKIYKLNFKED